jgi:hypothetical protein
LLLILVRLYFALSPSYLHPDENFQGPEVIAGKLIAHAKRWELLAVLVAGSPGSLSLKAPQEAASLFSKW